MTQINTHPTENYTWKTETYTWKTETYTWGVVVSCGEWYPEKRKVFFFKFCQSQSLELFITFKI